jgi:hypothetical protein
MIIEVFGAKHYNEDGFSALGGRTLKEEQENDKYKKESAIENGIDRYIIIDAKYSNFEYLIKSIKSSELAEMFDLSGIDWNDIISATYKNQLREVSDIYKQGLEINEMCKITNLSEYRLKRYIEIAKKVNMI